ncbi:uncharacterized protein LOC120425511 [Culex pipiens pallens]|uniref:uncharacterized protein LOC120425511 n=1 Tax=Culex pipiens pallens TaxID=42434 RepID=UPI001952ECDB|nr:uncharacterized protein LOC120425511 [Culex pipiens pallens]
MDLDGEFQVPPIVASVQLIYHLNLEIGGGLNERADVNALIQFITDYGKLRIVAEHLKCNVKAAKRRAVGNSMFRDGLFVNAMFAYNESICLALPGSDQLGIGYANRSAACFALGEYEMALFNIQMARKHNYPDKLMAKLLERERNCKQRIADGRSKGTVPCPRMGFNVDINPRIPFLAKGIAMGYDPRFGRGLVAEKDFNAGDIILDEKLELCGIDYNVTFQTCNQCSSRRYHVLIPCPKCPFFMFCSEECRELNWKLFHRFECDVATKLCSVSRVSDMIAPRLFFYGLSQFGDDVQAMMEYCEKAINGKFNPLDLDYTIPCRLDVFKAVHNTITRYDSVVEMIANNTAATYSVVFLMNPLVKSIIRTEPHRRFFIRSIQTYSKVAAALATNSGISKGVITTIRPVGNLFNHSCDPHAMTISDGGRVKMVMLRPARQGEQIFISYGPTWYKPCPLSLMFKCCCIVCDKGKAGREWHSLMDRKLPQNARKDVQLMKQILGDSGVNVASKMNAVQQLIKRYADYHPQREDIGYLLKLYGEFLCFIVQDEHLALMRAMLMAEQ